MESMSQFRKSGLYVHVAAHAVGWLFFANLIGLVLALMLLIPSVNNVSAPFTYGRLIPLHLNGHLYGWCMIPLIGILFAWYAGQSKRVRPAVAALNLWSIALGVGCLFWMAGMTSGKLFMEWRGGARITLSLTMVALAAALLWYMITEPDADRAQRIGKWVLWLMLLPVPVVMYAAADPSIFPSVNPDSGGATGSNLLISSLGLVTIIWFTPFLLRLKHRLTLRTIMLYAGLQAVHYAAFGLIGHGDRSHYELPQIIGLISLILWVPLLTAHFRRVEWPASARLWLWSFAMWGAFLVITANIMFAPGLLDQWKFTNFLVGHTHAAMAGMLSSYNMMILICLNPSGRISDVLGSRGLFWGWNIGTAMHVITLKLFGIMEGKHPDWLYTRTEVTNWAYSARLASGLIMFVVSALWLSRILELPKGTEYEKNA